MIEGAVALFNKAKEQVTSLIAYNKVATAIVFGLGFVVGQIL